MWTVTEFIEDTKWRGDEEGEELARRMQTILSEHLDYIDQPSSYFVGKLSSAVLRRYTAANHGDGAYHDWWDVYVEQCGAINFSVACSITKQNETGHTDDFIFNQWKELMTKARTDAIESPVGATQYPLPPK